MAIIDNVLLNTEDVLVIGGPSSITLSLDFGKQGSRGTKIFADDSTPTAYFSSEVNQSLDIQLYDMFLNTLTNDLYQYVNTPESYSWQLIGNLAGDPGPKGDTGSAGPAGQGLTAGGTAGQILVKLSATNYDTAWIDNYATSVRTLVKNNTGATMSKGSVVYISGSDSTNLLVSLADADTAVTSSQTLGFLETNLDQGATGYVVRSGLLAGINTNSASVVGQSIWLSSTAGQFVFGTPPAEPADSVYLGLVSKKNATTGEIFVNIKNAFELNEINGVSVPSPVANDLLYYGSDGLWKNSTIADLGIVKTGSTTNKVANNMLDNSTITIGSTSTSLGGTIAILPGVTSIAGNAGNNITIGNSTGTSTVLGAPININSTGSGSVVVSGGTGNTTIGNTTGTTSVTGTSVSINNTGSGSVTIGNSSSTVSVPVLRLTSTQEASTSTTDHAFQIGPHADGRRLILDMDEIHAYTNAAPGNLKINEDGGTVTIASASATSTTTINGPLITTTGKATYAPVTFGSSTPALLTTQAGATLEYNGANVFMTPNYLVASNTAYGGRGVVDASGWVVTNATRNLNAAATTAQAIFATGNSPLTAGSFAVAPATTYSVEMLVNWTSGATNHTTTFSFVAGGTTTFTSSALNSSYNTVAAGTAAASQMILTNGTTGAPSTGALATTTTTAGTILIKGLIRINASTSGLGTIIPSITFSAATGATPSILLGSYIKLTPIGTNSADIAIGAWA
jgi:hypothetical protein